MDVTTFVAPRKASARQRRCKTRSNAIQRQFNGANKRGQSTSEIHGRSLIYPSRASKTPSRPRSDSHLSNIREMASTWMESSLPGSGRVISDIVNDNYVNSRFRFMVRDGISIEECGEIPWDKIEHVHFPTSDDPDMCPICLHPTAAARITRCGHIFCFPCILHHLHERPKSKCPLCFAPVSMIDLRSVEYAATQTVNVDDVIQMCLLKRIKTHLYPRPIDPNYGEVFSRFLPTDSILLTAENDLDELKVRIRLCSI